MSGVTGMAGVGRKGSKAKGGSAPLALLTFASLPPKPGYRS